MEETKYFHDMEFFELVVLIIEDPFGIKGILEKFVQFLDDREPAEVQLWEANCCLCRWSIEVIFDRQGQMYLHNGLEQFARTYNLEVGCLLNFMYSVLRVKLFEGTMCDMNYHASGIGDNNDTHNPLVYVSGENI
jgi:hypothetical protein